jgi:hypothetical protein
MKRWQDWVNVVLGVWMFLSPWILGFAAAQGAAAWCAWILGAAVIVFAASAVYVPKAWEEAINIILGLCLIVAPWVLGFGAQSTATSNSVIVGVLVVAFGVWAMLRDTTVQTWWQRRHGSR